ncbi:dimethylsulfoniopropionate demethylase (plasmid) [Phaeobacter inhibens]|uniref:dimethylsulfoniopropionate demethylase n=1 Tax=Phaeobacter inhibens TaxID=221822 RepID=UPI0001632860|nr:dimethylsulfoniopropionate demethylase [Phaeobacter inhibens]AFO93464.1 putative aminomethyltransferase [Phaeobacter inhibens DSM 17395]AUQ48164.1 putative aminomethyltransferase [Phaeobacter inhibens]AXT24953.1 dimethylsulfoniopropionate demethylase [Phaeobacter inhibens]
MAHNISYSRRLRRTPFTSGVEAAGVKSFTVYNRMLLPTVFEDIEFDYHHLKSDVQVWDVAVERQVELIGPDASKLMQMLTPRDLSKMQDDQCYYVPIVDDHGKMLNDPVAIKHSDTRWWISIADGDLLFWVKALALGMGLNVSVFEPDVSPLAVQGPKASDLMERVFGNEVHDIRFFRQKRLKFADTTFVVSRSGYSKQGGFEIYVEGSEYGMPLWNALFEAGGDLNVRPGCPNLIERIEGGLLSYGNDMNMENTPLECGLGKFCKFAEGSEFIGKDAIALEASHGPARQIRAISIQGRAIAPPRAAWPLLKDGERVGQVTSAAWSPDFATNVAIGMVDASHWDPGTELTVETSRGPRMARVEEGFWI